MKRALLLFALAGCGANLEPTIETVRVSNPTAQRFQEFFLTLVGVEDPDGNVYNGTIEVKAKAEDVTLKSEIQPFATEPNQSKGDVIVGVALGGDIPLGTWNLEVIFEDELGADSAPARAEIDLTR